METIGTRVISAANLLDMCEQGVQAALAAGADQAEVYASSGRECTASFEKSDLNLASVTSETTFGIRVFYQGRLGFATSNRPDELTQTAAEAVTLAKASPADPMSGLPDPQPLPEVAPDVDPEVLAYMDPQRLTQIGSEFLHRMLDQDSRLTIDSGSVTAEEETMAIVSSQGIRASHRVAEMSGNVFGMAIDGEEVGSFSYDGDSVQKASEFRPKLEVAFDRFVEKCVGALGAGRGESFRGTIVIPPETVDDFLGDLLLVLGADMVRKGKSPMASCMGQLIANPLLSIRETGTGLPGYPIEPFDREGIPRQQTMLVSDGILSNFLYNSYEARSAQTQSNGHATGGAGSLPGVGPSTIQVSPGKTPIAELYAVDKGIYVTRFSGSSNPITGDFSGVVKGGFLIKAGERRPILETTIAGNLYDCLKAISAISQEVTVFGGVASFPALRIEDISITSG